MFHLRPLLQRVGGAGGVIWLAGAVPAAGAAAAVSLPLLLRLVKTGGVVSYTRDRTYGMVNVTLSIERQRFAGILIQ